MTEEYEMESAEFEAETSWNGQSEPQDFQFDNYNDYSRAMMRYELAQQAKQQAAFQAGRDSAQQAAPSTGELVEMEAVHHLRLGDQTDPHNAKRLELQADLEMYEEKLRYNSDPIQERILKDEILSVKRELSRLPDPPRIAAGKASILQKIEDQMLKPAMDAKTFGKIKQMAGKDKTVTDARETANSWNRKHLEQGGDYVYAVENDSRFGSPDKPRLVKVKVPENCLDNIRRGLAMGQNSWELCERFGLVETTYEPPAEGRELTNKELKAITDPSGLSQADYERWHEIHYPQPKYVSGMTIKFRGGKTVGAGQMR